MVNACLNDADKIRILYKNLQTIDLNVLEKAIYKAIDFVNDSISVVTKFKGNSRNANKIFHSKYQILSMISTTFKEMLLWSSIFVTVVAKKYRIAFWRLSEITDSVKGASHRCTALPLTESVISDLGADKQSNRIISCRLLLPGCSCLKRRPVAIIAVWAYMVIGYICKFFYCVIKRFFCHKFIEVCIVIT